MNIITSNISEERKQAMTVIVEHKDKEHFQLWSWEFFEKNILGQGTWMLRLASTEDMTKPEEHVYAEGNATVIIDELERNGTWGTWIVTETTERPNDILSSFGFENREYVVSVKEIA